MSSRPLVKPFGVITGASMGADVVSSVTVIQMISILSYLISWTGTPTGDFSVEVSNDYVANPSGGTPIVAGTWSTLPLSATTAASGAAGSGAIDIRVIGFYAIRLRYTRASGTGTLSATVNGKAA